MNYMWTWILGHYDLLIDEAQTASKFTEYWKCAVTCFKNSAKLDKSMSRTIHQGTLLIYILLSFIDKSNTREGLELTFPIYAKDTGIPDETTQLFGFLLLRHKDPLCMEFITNPLYEPLLQLRLAESPKFSAEDSCLYLLYQQAKRTRDPKELLKLKLTNIACFPKEINERPFLRLRTFLKAQCLLAELSQSSVAILKFLLPFKPLYSKHPKFIETIESLVRSLHDEGSPELFKEYFKKFQALLKSKKDLKSLLDK